MSMKNIWLATDLGVEALEPWAHALRICANSGAELRVLHVKQGQAPAWTQLPTLRWLLTQWGVLKADASLEDFKALGFRVRLQALEAKNPTGLLGAMIEVAEPDLLVLGSHRPAGLKRLLEGSVSEQLARRSPRGALIVADGAQNFVQPVSGKVRLRRILVPAGDVGAQCAIDLAESLVMALEAEPVEVIFVHVGLMSSVPQLKIPERPGWTSRTMHYADGDVVERILEAALEADVDLIAMATRGHDSWTDSLWGSRTERVLRDAPVPLLMARMES